MVLPEMDEVLRQLAAVDADDAPFAVASIVVAVLAALVLGPGDPAVFGKRGEIEARGQEQREGDHSSFSSCTGISRGSMGTKPWVTVIEAIRSCIVGRCSMCFDHGAPPSTKRIVARIGSRSSLGM